MLGHVHEGRVLLSGKHNEELWMVRAGGGWSGPERGARPTPEGGQHFICQAGEAMLS